MELTLIKINSGSFFYGIRTAYVLIGFFILIVALIIVVVELLIRRQNQAKEKKKTIKEFFVQITGIGYIVDGLKKLTKAQFKQGSRRKAIRKFKTELSKDPYFDPERHLGLLRNYKEMIVDKPANLETIRGMVEDTPILDQLSEDYKEGIVQDLFSLKVVTTGLFQLSHLYCTQIHFDVYNLFLNPSWEKISFLQQIHSYICNSYRGQGLKAVTYLQRRNYRGWQPEFFLQVASSIKKGCECKPIHVYKKLEEEEWVEYAGENILLIESLTTGDSSLQEVIDFLVGKIHVTLKGVFILFLIDKVESNLQNILRNYGLDKIGVNSGLVLDLKARSYEQRRREVVPFSLL